MSTGVFIAVLVAALLHAVWNALVKSGGDRVLVLAAVNAAGAVVALPVVLFSDFPAAASWPWLLLSALLHCGYYFFLIRAYGVGDLAHVYPLARGSAPLLVTAGAALLAGEYLPPLAVLGVGIASAGIVSLAFEGGPPWRRDARALWFALATSLFIGGYTVVDGTGVRLAQGALGYIGWLFLIDGVPLAVYALWTRAGVIRPFLRRERWRCLGGGLASMLAYGLVIWAMSLGAMGMVSALRETSVLFAVLIGVFLLGEHLTARRIGAAIAVCAGVALMHIGT